MRAWVIRELGEPEDVLELREIQQLTCEEGEVLVEMKAAALNFFERVLKVLNGLANRKTYGKPVVTPKKLIKEVNSYETCRSFC